MLTCEEALFLGETVSEKDKAHANPNPKMLDLDNPDLHYTRFLVLVTRRRKMILRCRYPVLRLKLPLAGDASHHIRLLTNVCIVITLEISWRRWL